MKSLVAARTTGMARTLWARVPLLIERGFGNALQNSLIAEYRLTTLQLQNAGVVSNPNLIDSLDFNPLQKEAWNVPALMVTPAVVLAVLLTSFFNHRWTQIPEFAFAFISVRSRFEIQ